MIESHVLSQDGINHSQLKAALQSRQKTIREADVASAGRLLSTHHNRQLQAASATEKPIGVTCGYPESRGCTCGARDAPIATQAYDNTYTRISLTPTTHIRLHPCATTMSIHTPDLRIVHVGGHVMRLRSRSSYVCVGKMLLITSRNAHALANGIVVIIVIDAVVA